MILRTPPPKKRRGEGRATGSPPPPSHRRLIIYEDNPAASLPETSDQFLCTYQCRQMVKADFVDALTTAHNQVGDYQSKLEVLNQNMLFLLVVFVHHLVFTCRSLNYLLLRRNLLLKSWRKIYVNKKNSIVNIMKLSCSMRGSIMKQEESNRLKERVTKLRSEILLLESKLSHGEFSCANTKVLRMVNTLAVDNEAKQTIEALQTELPKIKERLQAVEELKSQPGDTGKLVDSYISEKILKLKEQIVTLEKREERYKTVFADRISVFSRACCELFGYKIVMDEHQRPNEIPVTHFMLQSIYAQSDDEKLQFEYESGNANILANDYTSQAEISRQIEIFIRKMNSIPAFTANLTVESFNRRTVS